MSHFKVLGILNSSTHLQIQLVSYKKHSTCIKKLLEKTEMWNC